MRPLVHSCIRLSPTPPQPSTQHEQPDKMFFSHFKWTYIRGKITLNRFELRESQEELLLEDLRAFNQRLLGYATPAEYATRAA